MCAWHGISVPTRIWGIEWCDIALVEILREAATIIMLIGVGILSAKTDSLRFACILFCFAIWDIFYYIFLWLFLGWPQSFFTWDILFLIPVPWIGPVITPCIVSMTMILLASCIFYFHQSGLNTGLKIKEVIPFSVGSYIIILSFIWNYMRYINEGRSTETANSLSGEHTMFSDILNYVPVDFNWFLFITGESILLLGIIILFKRMKNINYSFG